ncbi:unnamed protein product [Adineta steineri]|uniref:Chitin-binding type-2 domain-containing protein n=2 Tax=Adineta steineri TaxID=433720 RepID=A0A819SZC2_9BILA|nr:unnamed protein product [Adineta steineri]CAF4015638.1 unnamed protein product [Adineta steineri]CAF4072977.1 unnamed protein product [Adineta steineri]
MIVSLLFMGIFIQVYSEDTFDCTGYEDDSFHPMYNTDNCRYYWHCIYVDTVYMRAIKRSCPAGTEFNNELKECEIPSSVNCIKHNFSYIPRKEWITTQQTLIVDTDITTITISQSFQVLPNTTSPLPSILLIEQFLKNLIARQQKSTTNEISQSTLVPTTTTSEYPRKHLNRHRNNLILNILTSHEHKIRRFSINQTNGILIHCNEIRRRRLRELIFRTTTTTTIKLPTSSSKICYNNNNERFFIIFITFFLFLQK